MSAQPPFAASRLDSRRQAGSACRDATVDAAYGVRAATDTQLAAPSSFTGRSASQIVTNASLRICLLISAPAVVGLLASNSVLQRDDRCELSGKLGRDGGGVWGPRP
ncbi:MAG: hypothetical protein ACYCU0_02265, partial [Solirubrobacteraceae bacterium]